MAEPLAVDPTGLSAAAAKLAGLVFPQPPAPIAVSGTDSVVAAINETMPSIESLVSDGLPGVKAALTRTASNMNAAADVYAKTDQSLGTSLSQYAFGSSGEGLAGVASVGGQPSQATQLLSTPVSQVTTQLGETAAELAPRVVATVPQLVQLAPHAVQMSQNASPIAQTISQTAQQAAQSAQGGSGPMPAQLASAEKPATEQAEPVHEVTNDDQGDQGDVQPAAGVKRAQDIGADGPDILDSRSHLYPDSLRTMGYDVGSAGFELVLSRDLAAVVEQYLGNDVTTFLASHGLSTTDVGAWVTHPGGPKIINAITETLDLSPQALELTWRSLGEIGNLSSASVLHVLRDTIAKPPPSGSPGLMIAMGPGFCSELVLLRWH